MHSSHENSSLYRCGDGRGRHVLEEILQSYPDLELEDVREALQFAAEAVREREIPLIGS